MQHLTSSVSEINSDKIIFSDGNVLRWDEIKEIIFLESAGGPVAPSYTTKRIFLKDQQGKVYSPANLKCIKRKYFLSESLLFKTEIILKNALKLNIPVEIQLAEGRKQLLDIAQELRNIAFALSPEGKQQYLYEKNKREAKTRKFILLFFVSILCLAILTAWGINHFFS